MATLSRSRSGRRFPFPLIPTIVAAVLVIALVATVLVQIGVFNRADPLQGRSTATVTQGSVIDQVSATGAIEPRVTSELAFPTAGGRVSEIFVGEGDTVTQDQPLIALEVRRLQANVAVAEATVAQAQADLQGLRDGATPEQIAAAEAQVAAAQGNLIQTEGNVTAQDVQAAQARVNEAQALVSRLAAGAEATDVQQADAQLQQAQVNLQTQRDQLSRAKTEADARVQQAAAELTQAQAAYGEAKSNWDFVRETGNDPRQPEISGPTGTQRNRVENAQREQYYAAFIQAEAGLKLAEQNVAQAQIDAEEARKAELTGIQLAEEQVRAAQANATAVQAGPDVDELAAAQAQLATAQAELARLQGQQRNGALQAQRANVANAEAQLGELLADPKASDLARAEASVAQAQAQLELARAELDDATLRAPFAGTVGTITIAPGETIGEQAPITLLDTSRFVVKVAVDEVDVARVTEGQLVEVLIDALGEPALAGTVRRITPQAQADSDVTAYEVLVEVDPGERNVKAGMTASAAIIVNRADNVLAVPTGAVREENGQQVVDVVTTDADGRRQVAPQVVETGLEADGTVEIRSGLTEGQEIVVP